jgi:DNA-binding SARP family transcriptional activator
MASATLRIRLLGELDLRRDEVAVPPLGSARAESLLAYLLLHREAPQPRQRLAFLLWPDSTESQARTNLRHLLYKLRQALPDPDRFLEVTQRTLRWRDDAPWELDVAAFEGAVARAEEATQTVPALQEAVELYAATCSRAATTSGCWRSGCAGATSRPWSGWPSCWRPGASMPGQSGMPSDFCARTRCGRRPTGS